MLCPECRIKEKASAYQKKVFKLALNKDIDELYTANPKGCPKCNNGYHGRIALQEVLLINDEIRNALNVQDLDKKDLNKLVYGSDVITLLQDGLLKVLDGSTSFDEIYKLIDVDDDLDAYCEIKGITYDEHNGQIIKLNDNTNKQKNDIIEKEEILKNKNEEEEVL